MHLTVSEAKLAAREPNMPTSSRVTLADLPKDVFLFILENKDAPDGAINWQGIFDKIASRYYHLTHGKAQSVTTYKLAALEQLGHWYPVSQWDYHESQPGRRLYHENSIHISRLGVKPYLFQP